MKRPVVRLRLALYGHPDSGTYWERHCDAHLRSVGFEPISEVWNSCYWHAKLKLYLVVYVDDFKLSGPKQDLSKGWELIRKGLEMEAPTPVGVFLGCKHTWELITMADGHKATLFKYEMADFVRSCVDKSLEHAPGVRHRAVEAPFLPED